jgi:hypothetical protein
MDERPYFNKELDVEEVDYRYWVNGYEEKLLIAKLDAEHLKNLLTTIDTLLEATSDYRLNRPVLHRYTKVIQNELNIR